MSGEIGEAARLVDSLSRALDGGPPVLIGDPPARAVPADVALVLRTSGSRDGIGRPVALTASAVLAGADATHARLQGSGRWVLALPPRHVAGVQVLVRAIRAATAPVVVPGTADPVRLAETLASAPDDLPLYLSLVPTQLHRVLEHGGAAVVALRRTAAVLLGGAAAPVTLLESARAAGIPVVTTYGMTETCGGCVYDGVPLDGVQVRLAEGRIELGGPVVAQGYLDDGPQPFETRAGERWFRTSDLGELDEQGRLRVLGRIDDVIVTGGVNVHPLLVERRLATIGPRVGEVVVLGVDDPEWGSLVTALVTGPCSLREVRDAVGHGAAAPRALVRVPSIPLRGPGKPDRIALAAIAAAAIAEGTAERA